MIANLDVLPDARFAEQSRAIQRKESPEYHAAYNANRRVRQGQATGNQVARGIFLQMRGQSQVRNLHLPVDEMSLIVIFF